jgi:hypothetical protein
MKPALRAPDMPLLAVFGFAAGDSRSILQRLSTELILCRRLSDDRYSRQ